MASTVLCILRIHPAVAKRASRRAFVRRSHMGFDFGEMLLRSWRRPRAAERDDVAEPSCAGWEAELLKDEQVPRLFGAVPSSLVESLFQRGRCVVLSDVAAAWTCTRWDLSWLANTLGHHEAQVSHKDACGNVLSREVQPLRRFIESETACRHARGRQARHGTVPYVDNFNIALMLGDAKLRQAAPSSNLFGPSRSLVIYGGFLGPAGSVTRIHVDSEDNLILCAFGRKLFVLVPPQHLDDIDFDAREQPLNDPWSDDIDAQAREHPMFRKCAHAVRTVTLQAGEVLLQPKGWSHWVHNLELSLSIPCWAKDLPPDLLQ